MSSKRNRCPSEYWCGYLWQVRCLRTAGHVGPCSGRKDGQRQEWTIEQGDASKVRAMVDFLSR